MEQKCLIDTNILIYFYNDLIPEKSIQSVDNIFLNSFNISIISKIEFLGWQKFDENQFQNAVKLIENANILNLNEKIIIKTIELKRSKNIKLPDAVIAATCLISKYTLVTRNKSDFDKIQNLKIYNPFD